MTPMRKMLSPSIGGVTFSEMLGKDPLSSVELDDGSVEKANGKLRRNDMTSDYEPPGERRDLIWAAVDLDGTLAKSVWTADKPTPQIGDPIKSNVAKVHRLLEAGYKIVIHTSRPWSDYERIESWLRHHGVPFKTIVCGKLLAAVYVDDRAVPAAAPSWHAHAVDYTFWAREAFEMAAQAGWFPLGTHANRPDIKLTFAGRGLDDLPLWERCSDEW